MAVGALRDDGAVLGLFAGPQLGLDHGGHRPLPHRQGQVVGQLPGHPAALGGDGVLVPGALHQALAADVVKAGADLEIIDQLGVGEGGLQLALGHRPAVLDQIAQQQPDLGAAGQPAGPDPGGESIAFSHGIFTSFCGGGGPAGSVAAPALRERPARPGRFPLCPLV